MRTLLPLVAFSCVACGSPKSSTSTTSNTHATGSPATASSTVGADSDCLGGGHLRTDKTDAKDCRYVGEVMGPAKQDGSITVLACCYATPKTACASAGCVEKDCTIDDKATSFAKFTCKDTTHGGVPTNP